MCKCKCAACQDCFEETAAREAARSRRENRDCDDLTIHRRNGARADILMVDGVHRWELYNEEGMEIACGTTETQFDALLLVKSFMPTFR